MTPFRTRFPHLSSIHRLKMFFSTNGIAMNPTPTHWIAGIFRFCSSLDVGAIQFAYVIVENSQSGCRSAGSVFLIVGTWVEPPHDLERADVPMRKFHACSFSKLFPPNCDQISRAVLFRFFLSSLVILLRSCLVGEYILAHLAPDEVSANFRVAIFVPKKISFDW